MGVNANWLVTHRKILISPGGFPKPVEVIDKILIENNTFNERIPFKPNSQIFNWIIELYLLVSFRLQRQPTTTDLICKQVIIGVNVNLLQESKQMFRICRKIVARFREIVI